MTSVGHTLTGIALGTLTVPRSETPAYKWVVFNAFGLLANLPDLPLPGWGHDAYHVSHSLFVNLGLMALATAITLASPAVRERLRWRPAAALAAAWLSHLLLDSLYDHGRGIGILWPLSDAHLTLPLPWFSTAELHPWNTSHNLRVFAIELAFYGTVLGACLIARLRRPSRRGPGADPR